MPIKLLDSLKEEVYLTFLTNPAKSDYQVAEQFKVSRSLVYNLRQKFIRHLDYKLVQETAGKFLADFQTASDYYKLQITELEDKKAELEKYKEGKKTVFKKAEDGHTFASEVELNEFDKLAIDRDIRDIMKQQQSLQRDIMMLARQGEAVEVMRMLQSGRIQLTA